MSDEETTVTVPTADGVPVIVENIIPGTANVPAGIVPTSQGESYPVPLGNQDQSGVENLFKEESSS